MLLGMFDNGISGIDSNATHHVFMYTGYVWRLLSALPAIIFAACRTIPQQNMDHFTAGACVMKVWRRVTGKLFWRSSPPSLTRYSVCTWTCASVLNADLLTISKHGNLSSGTNAGRCAGRPVQQHTATGVFYAATITSFSRFCVHLSMTATAINPAVCRRIRRTQFWVSSIKNGRVAPVGPRGPVPHDGTRRPILVNGARSARLSPLSGGG